MLTFPSVNDRERRVRLIKVNGFFDRGKGRVNEGEAIAIIEEIKRRYKNPELTSQTIGVVTFNISQQTLIEDMLQEEYQKDAAFDQWANVGEEPLFVKNLENVQGDERDIILFSVAFGPDEAGKLSLNFGPLNKEGGWKRLNVAVSRARLEMVVFTIMTADMIDLKRTKSKGVESLKNFLEFAEKGRLQGEYIEMHVQKNQGIMEHICQKIADAGFKYQKFVGHSNFKIDIAVINPYNEEEYLLGIMLDGEAYKQSTNTKDREIAQLSVLQGLGWKIHRIWTMDWWDNRDKELTKLLQLLEEQRTLALEKCQKMKADEEGADEVNEGTVEAEELDSEKVLEYAEEPSTEVVSEKKAEEPVKAEEPQSKEVVKQLETSEVINIDYTFMTKALPNEASKQKIATKKDEILQEIVAVNPAEQIYRVEDFVAAEPDVTPMTTAAFVQKDAVADIVEKLQQIIDAEAPINYECMTRKVLRAFSISRSSAQTLEAVDKAVKKTMSKTQKQLGMKFIWRRDQDPDTYRVYRRDVHTDDKRNLDEICQQELKNAVCVTLAEKGALDKETLIKETIRTMGYARSGAALVAAVNRGIKYGRKTGEIIENEDQLLELSTDH
jgi:very-short-patch-repair endonuclease